MAHDLVLINPASRKRVYQALGSDLAAIEPPVWLGLLATFVRRHGYRVAAIDAEAEELSHAEVAERVRDLKPSLAAIVVYGHQPSASTQIMPAARGVAEAIRGGDKPAKIIFVGGHVAALPERTLREEPIDFACSGEGFCTLVDLLQALRTPNADFSAVRDLWSRDGQRFVQGPPAPLVKDLDEQVPEMAWDLLPMDRYRAHNWHCLGESGRQPYAALYTTLGCPYRCTFCCIQAPFKRGEAALGLAAGANSYRYWSPQRVVDQLAFLNQHYGVRHVKIADEMFVLQRRHVEQICDGIIARGLDLNLWAYARVDTVKDGMLPKLRQAGFRWLAFGIEAANRNVRRDVQKDFDESLVHRTLEGVRREGIHSIGNYIFGLPEDDLQTMQETLDLSLELCCEFGNFYTAMAYPGSELYRDALREGWTLPATWSGYSQHAVDTLPLPTRHVSSADVLRFRDKAFHAYFGHPRYLQHVQNTFGQRAEDQIRGMTMHKLRRKILEETNEPAVVTA